MVFKEIFEKLGDMTISAGRKVEEGVKAPATKLTSIRPSFTGRRDFRGTIKRRSTSMIMERMRMTSKEVEIFKDLIEADRHREEEEKESGKRYTEASLEELLKEEEKKFDPRILLLLGSVSGLILLLITVTLGLGLDIGLILMFAVTSLSVILTVAPKLQKGRKSGEASRQLP
ncbi:MAG: type II secretion system F family protein, partial [Methanobacteriales archaeon]|nr:type II secretion system F family protein [Methanobacteriales archaeon]